MPRNNPLPLLILPKTSEILNERNINLDGSKIQINITTRNAEGRISNIYRGQCNVVQIAEDDNRNCAVITEHDIRFIVDEEIRFAQLPSPTWSESDVWIDPVKGPNASLYKGLEKINRKIVQKYTVMSDIGRETHVTSEVPQVATNVDYLPIPGISSSVNNIEEYFNSPASATSDSSKPQCSYLMESDQNIQNIPITQENKKEFMLCFECGKSFTFKKSFKAHQMRHKRRDLKNFASDGILKEHRLAQKRKIKCHYCKFTSTTIDKLIYHMELKHHRFTCKHEGCYTIFNSLNCLLEHKKLHYIQVPNDENCSSDSDTTQEPEKQLEKLSTIDYENDIAEKEQEFDIAEENSNVHTNIANEMSNITMKSKKDVKRKKRECPECKKIFFRASRLERHQRKHAQSKVHDGIQETNNSSL